MSLRNTWQKFLKTITSTESNDAKMQFMDFVGVYVLNLRDRKDRREALIEATSPIKTDTGDTLDKHIQWVDAIDGRYLHNVDQTGIVNEYDFEYHWNIEPDPAFLDDIEHYKKQKIKCTKSEVAISLGHMRMWEQFKESKKPVALFLEDDAIFHEEFTKEWNNALTKVPADWDMIYLSGYKVKWGGHKTEKIGNKLLKVNQGVWWMSGYLLSESGVNKLLKSKPIVGPIDVWINYQFKDMNVYMCQYLPINQDGGIKSDNTYSWYQRFWVEDTTLSDKAVAAYYSSGAGAGKKRD